MITDKIKKISTNGTIKALKATEIILNGTGKAVDGANILTDNIGGKLESTFEGLKSITDAQLATGSQSEEKKISLDEMLQNAVDEYNMAFTELNDFGMSLYVERERSQDLISHIENLINSIANRPKTFDAEIERIHMYREQFNDVCDFAKEELIAARKSAVGAGSGVAAGAAVASVAPTAAMWIATTFGTASTGTAISSLSGAAATNAALAWLGGGALAAGGGGMGAGTAFLALAGPVGWGIAGITVFSSVALFAKNRMKSNKEKNEEIEKVKVNSESVKESAEKINMVLLKTIELRKKTSEIYRRALSCYGKRYTDISGDNQLLLGSLVNNTKSLAISLGETL